jgi:hypothetical protein
MPLDTLQVLRSRYGSLSSWIFLQVALAQGGAHRMQLFSQAALRPVTFFDFESATSIIMTV